MTPAEFSLFFEGADLERRFVESPAEIDSNKSLESLNKSELIWRLNQSVVKESNLEKINKNLTARIHRLQALVVELKQGNLDLSEGMILMQQMQFTKSSERSTKEEIAESSNEKMKALAHAEREQYSSKSSVAKAMNYFLENYDGLTLFITNPEFPIDNNAAERILRNPVIGRKTWYGTHSRHFQLPTCRNELKRFKMFNNAC